MAKGVECHYPLQNQSRDARSQVHQRDVVALNETEVAPGVEETTLINDSDFVLDNTLAMSDTGIASLGDLDLLNADIDFTDFLLSSQTMNDGKAITSTPIMEWSPLDSQHSTPNNQLSVSIPLSLPTYTPRSLIQRPEIKAGTQRIANLMFHTLKSYPQMMLRPDTLPPFIHPAWVSGGVFDTDHMEPLNNCISLVHMVNSRVRGSRKLFWRNVRMECERLCEEVCLFFFPLSLDVQGVQLIWIVLVLEHDEVGVTRCHASACNLHHHENGRRRDGV
jgi:hypothetical protein